MNKRLSFLLIFLAAAQLSFSQSAPFIRGPGASGINVNSYTGNMHYERTDVFVPCVGLNLYLTFSYNVNNTKIDSGYGYGWTHNYNWYYEVVNNGDIKLWDSKGKYKIFEKINNSYVNPTGVYDTLIVYDTSKVVYITTGGYKYYFEDSTHRKLTKLEDPYGFHGYPNPPSPPSNAISIAYTNGRPTTITHNNSSKFLNLLYNPDGNLYSVEDPNGTDPRFWVYEYSSSKMTKAVNPLGYSIAYTYNPVKKIKTIKDRNGNIFSLEYNEDLLTNKTGSVNKITSSLTEMNIDYNYDSLKTIITEVVDTGTQTTTYSFDTLGRLINKLGNCCGFNISYEYDSDGNLIKVIDANGNVNQFEYNSSGNLIKEIDPYGKTRKYSYIPFNISAITDGNTTLPGGYHVTPTLLDYSVNKNEDTTKYFYDGTGMGNLVFLSMVKRPEGVTDMYSYSNNG